MAWIDQYRKGGAYFGSAESFWAAFGDDGMTDEQLDYLFEDYLAQKDILEA
jgi:hypothetical protein